MWWEWTFQNPGYGWTAGEFGPWNEPIYGLAHSLSSENVQRQSYLDGESFGDAVQQALNAMLPGIKPNLSLVNSLYELKDMKTLPKTWSKLNGAMDAFNNLLKGKYKNLSRPLKQILNSGADTYLQEKFNVAPLLSDIAGINRSLSRLHSEIAKLLKEEGKPLKYHYSTKLVSNIANSNETSAVQNLPNLDGSCVCRREIIYSPAQFNATMAYSYSILEAMKRNITLRALLDSLGVNANPQIIWAAIPWSFVVDWVAGVGPWLSQFRVRNIEPTVNISWFQYSVKSERIINTYKTVGVGGIHINGIEVPVITRKDKSYQRSGPFQPSIIASIRSSGLSPTEFSLTGALVLTKATH